MSEYINADCMDYLPTYADDEFDLAIVDPPYGGGAVDDADDAFNGAVVGRFGGRFAKYELGGVPEIKAARTGGNWWTRYQVNGGTFDRDIRHWDIAPSREYFEQLFRVSKNQIIWGGNYFDLPPTRCFIVWRKSQIPLEGFTMSALEYAWTSFNQNARMYVCPSNATSTNQRIHPTQKPVELYKWLLENFAEPGMRILDTHVGSASSLIACERLGFEYTGFEVYKTYYDMSRERMERELAQLTLF